MSYELKQFTDEHVILATCNQDYNMAQELDSMVEDILLTSTAESQPSYLIIDMRGVSFGLDSVIVAANRARSDENSVFHHPSIEQVIFVTDSRLIELSARGLNTEIFGRISVPVFHTVEEARSYVRQR
jgi:hypothetical protein